MTNHWWEIEILAEIGAEDTIFWRLESFGCQGMVTENKQSTALIRTYLPEAETQSLDLSALSLWLRQDALISNFSTPKVRWHLIAEEDWGSTWKKHWQPQEIGDGFLIYPAWYTPPLELERTLIRIDPGLAFGTGVHLTTQLCLEAIEMRFLDEKTKGSTLADIGCGSGILSIGALKLGAKKVYAVDTDPLAIRATHDNRILNDLDEQQLIVAQGSISYLSETLSTPVDGIFCNILADLIVDLIPQMSAISHETTWGVLSGILLEQVPLIADILEEHDWIVAALWKRKEWCCFNIRRS